MSFSTAEVLDFVMDEGEDDFVDTFQQGSDDEIGFLDDEEDEHSRDDALVMMIFPVGNKTNK